MKCPFCGEENTKVIDSRPAEDNSAIRRRRQCDECGKRFTTYEKVETIPLIVIKKDNDSNNKNKDLFTDSVEVTSHSNWKKFSEFSVVMDLSIPKTL